MLVARKCYLQLPPTGASPVGCGICIYRHKSPLSGAINTPISPLRGDNAMPTSACARPRQSPLYIKTHLVREAPGGRGRNCAPDLRSAEVWEAPCYCIGDYCYTLVKASLMRNFPAPCQFLQATSGPRGPSAAQAPYQS